MSIPQSLAETARDVRYGARVLARSPLFSVIAVLSLAIGIGGAATVFTLLNAVLLRDLPVPNPHQLFSAGKSAPGRTRLAYSWPSFEQVRADLNGRAEVCAYTRPTGMQIRVNPASGSADHRGLVQMVSGEFFQVFRQQPQAGRLLLPGDNREVGAHPVAVISDAFWARHFERSPAAVGREIVVNGATLSIVGVAPRGFFGPTLAVRNPDVWVPLLMQPSIRYNTNASTASPTDPSKPWPPQTGIEWLDVFVRVPAADAPGVAAAMTTQFQREGTEQYGSADAQSAARVAEWRVTLAPASRGAASRLQTDLTQPLYVLLGMVGILLVIASGNLASLLITRAHAREREIAIRLSIGAGRGRVVRQLLAETLVLAAVGGGLGLLVAAWSRDGLLRLFASGASVIDLDTGFDWRVLTFCVATTVLSGLVAGLAPALRGTRLSLVDALKAQGRSVGSTRRSAILGKSLVAAQLAFCLVLLVLGVLFTRSMQSLLDVNVGYDRDGLLVASLDIRSTGLPPSQRQALYDRVVERVRAVPGVQSASLSLMGPFGGGQRASSFSVEGYAPQPGERLMTNEEYVTDDYFDTVGLRIVAGRGFVPSDNRPGGRATLVNEAVANRFFPGGTAIGKRWDYGGDITAEASVIVGVVEDARTTSLRGGPPFMVYHFVRSHSDEVLSSLEVRTTLAPSAIASEVRQALAAAEPNLPVIDIMPLRERLNRGAATERLIAALTTTFSGLALLLACLGLYGTISYGVTRRVTELGVRMALGAARRDVLWLVIREAAIVVTAGALVGIPLTIVASRGLSAMLYGVGAMDPLSYALAGVALALVAGGAAFLPAHRASRIDPMVALRKD